MSTIRLRTLTDFVRHGYLAQVQCNACGHKSQVDPARLVAECSKRGASVHLRHVERQLRCAKCGEKQASLYPGGTMKGR